MALLLAGCSQTAPDTREADAKAIKDLESRWNQDFASKDVEKMVAHYADDAVVMSPGMPPSSGKDAIRKMLTEMTADPALSLKFQASRVEVAKSSDIAYTQGSYSKQPDGSWKAVADIATSEAPPAARPAPTPKKKRLPRGSTPRGHH